MYEDWATEDLIEHLVYMNGLVSDAVANANELKGLIRERFGEGKYECGKRKVEIRPNRKFNPQRAEELLPAEWLIRCRAMRIDTKLARAILPPELYRACQTVVGEPIVVIN